MKSFAGLAVAAVGLFSFACSAGDPSQGASTEQGASEEVASTDQAVCSNYAGTGAVLASLAVAAAAEMHRWNAPVDFQWNTSTAMLEVSSAGKARCGGTCRNTNAILALQQNSAQHTITFAGGDVLDVNTLRGVIQDHYNRQTNCNNWWGEYSSDGCWVEAHDLWFWKKAPGTCATDNYFWANKAGIGGSTLDHPDRLAYQLYFAGYPDNPYINFRNNGSNVAVDPTIGLTEDSVTTSGSCTAACAQYSTSNLSGSCCACNGVTKSFARSPFSSDMYLCK